MNGINKQVLQIWGGGSLTVYSTEIDFGSWKPVRSKRFTITDAWVNSSSKVFVSWSWDTATWRVWNESGSHQRNCSKRRAFRPK